MVCSHNHQVSINVASIYKLFERWSTSRRLHSQVNLVRNVVKVSYTWLNHWNSNPYIPIHSLRINILRLVEHYLLAFTMEDVHSKYEDLYANICEIVGKCRINGNISVSFLNQKVLDTALESWALALQESTNNIAKGLHSEGLIKSENEAMSCMPFDWGFACHLMTCEALATTHANNRHQKTKSRVASAWWEVLLS